MTQMSIVFATLRTLVQVSRKWFTEPIRFGAGIGVGLSHHLNSGMSFECDNDDEDIQVEITVYELPELALTSCQ